MTWLMSHPIGTHATTTAYDTEEAPEGHYVYTEPSEPESSERDWQAFKEAADRGEVAVYDAGGRCVGRVGPGEAAGPGEGLS